MLPYIGFDLLTFNTTGGISHENLWIWILHFVSFIDPLTTPNAVYGIVELKCSDDIMTTDNPVYGARIDVSTETH